MQASNQVNLVQIKDTTSNPAPIGLFAFGMTTVLLNLHNAGLFPMNTVVLGMGIFFGGIAQIIAGVMEWKKNNIFGATAFISYGSFWLTLVAILVLPEMKLGIAAGPTAMAAYLAMWGLFSVVMLVGAWKINRALQVIFATLVILFILLIISEATGSALIKQIAGYEGIICGLSAIYAASAVTLNEIYGRTVAPLGPMSK